MKKLGVFDSIEITMDKVDGSSKETDLIIRVKEKNWWKLNVGASTDGYEGTAETTCTLVNPLGTAERLHLSKTKGHVGSDVTRLVYSKPHFLGLPWLLNANLSDESLNYCRFSSYTEQFRGGKACVSNEDGTHEIALEMGWRDIVPRRNPTVSTAFAASRSILAEATPSMKTSLSYTFKEDTRDDPIVPESGDLFKSTTEVAGLMGDVQFVKNETTLQRHLPVGPTIEGHSLLTLSLCSRFGFIKTYGSDKDRAARISDRFFLGGPTILRGFQHKGIGPRASPEDGGNLNGDALGGEVMYNASVSLGFPLPIPALMMAGFKGHFFANAGNLTSFDRAIEKEKWAKNLLDETRASAGFGIVWKTNFGRLEANYSWLLRAHAQDQVQNGQLGLSMSFS